MAEHVRNAHLTLELDQANERNAFLRTELGRCHTTIEQLRRQVEELTIQDDS